MYPWDFRRIRPVTAKAEVDLWRELLARWHHLGFRVHGGAHLRYLAWDAQGRLLAAMEFSAAAWNVAPRDRFLRWTPEQRMARLHLLVDQSTFLILPWLRVKFLASSLLGRVARRLPGAGPRGTETAAGGRPFAGRGPRWNGRHWSRRPTPASDSRTWGSRWWSASGRTWSTAG